MAANTTVNATIQAIINHTAPVQLTVTPAPTPIPPDIATTALDWAPIPVPPFNIPLWCILAFLSVAALVIIIFHWTDKSGDLNAIKPWFIKIKEIAVGKKQVIRLSRAGNFIPDCLDIFDNVLAYGESEENINQWHLNSPQGIIKIGGISAAVISEDNDQNRDLVTEIAICHASEYLEAHIEDLKIKLNERFQDLVRRGAYPKDAENPANLIRPITNGDDYIGQFNEDNPPDYDKSGRFLLQLLNPEGIYVDAINLFNQNRMRKFWFKGKTSAFFGGENLRKVEDKFIKKQDKEPGFFQKYGAMMIGALVFLGCIIAGAVIPLG